MEKIENAEKATIELARIYGEPEVLEGYGRRNTTLLAIAPTTSSSAILGQASPGIEPLYSNYYKAGLAKGNFMRKNKYLEALLKEKGIDNEETWRSIMLNNGSVNHLKELDDKEKAVFKESVRIFCLSQFVKSQFDSINQKKNNIIPPTINHITDDHEIDNSLKYTFNKFQKREVRAAISNTFGFGGHNACVVFKKLD